MKDIVIEIVACLQGYGKKRIDLDLLQQHFGRLEYCVFQKAIQQLLTEGILEPVQSAGTDFSGLPRRFRIVPGRLFSTADTIQQDAWQWHLLPKLDLSYYYEQPLAVWQRDLPRIRQLNTWLQGKQEVTKASNQQRSWDIFHDEKYLLGDGAKLLQHLHMPLLELGIVDTPEPLMLAVNPAKLQQSICHHLVVENKAPYTKILPYLPKSQLTSLILGYGWKIAGNLSLLPQQIGRTDAKHSVWYFGDFDWEGLAIWHNLHTSASLRAYAKVKVRLAVPFYRAFLSYEAPCGKENQQRDEAALADFVQELGAEGTALAEILHSQCYYPQEALSATDLQCCLEELEYGT